MKAPPQYPQSPGQLGPPPQPTAKPTFKQRFRAMSRWKRFGTIGCSTIIGAIMVCSLCAVVGNALPKSPQPPATAIAPVPTHQVAHRAPTREPTPTPKPTPKLTPTATPTPTPSPTPVPTATPTPMPPAPVQQPAQQPPVQQAPAPPPPASGVNGNPWGYDFNPGNLIYSPNSGFCSYFSCINNFWNGNGYVEECSDGMYGKSGGISWWQLEAAVFTLKKGHYL